MATMMRRCVTYAVLMFCACFGPSTFAMERPVSYLTASLDRMGDMHLAATARLELTLAQWRTGSEGTDQALSSNLRASSNHFIMASVKVPAEPVVNLS